MRCILTFLPKFKLLIKLRQKPPLLMTNLLNYLKTKYDEINDAATEQKKTTKITDLVDDIIAQNNPFQNLGTEDIWIEDNIFDKNDTKETIEISKNILKEIKEKDPFLDFSIPTEQIIDDF